MRSIYCVVVCLLTNTLLHAFTTHHFYRASYFWQEPRFDRDKLKTIEVSLAGGCTHSARNSIGHKTSAGNIYSKNSLCACPSIIELFEAHFTATQNLTSGFFLQEFIPVKQLRVYTLTNPLVIATACDSMLSLSRKDTAVGDSAFLFGWSHTCQQTLDYDFLDVSIQTGILLPTAPVITRTCAVSCFPLGYNGHLGIPFVADGCIGIYDWLTLGAHADVLVFFKQKECFSSSTSNMLKKEWVKPGTIVSLGSYVKADHIIWGASCVLGLSYAHKTHDKSCVTKHKELSSWYRTTLHFLAEYDFTHYCSSLEIGPRLAFIYNKSLTGKRVFQTSMTGAYVGLEWDFSF